LEQRKILPEEIKHQSFQTTTKASPCPSDAKDKDILEPDMLKVVTPTFYKNKFFYANRNAYKNAYQIIVLMKNFPKINLV
jgi:hypothetical protein